MNSIRSFKYLKELRQLHYKPACQKDSKEGDKDINRTTISGPNMTQLSFWFILTKAAWDKGNLGPGPDLVGMVFQGRVPTS